MLLLLKAFVPGHVRKTERGAVFVQSYSTRAHAKFVPSSQQTDLFAPAVAKPVLLRSGISHPAAVAPAPAPAPDAAPATAPKLDSYDHVLVGFSGGKDSIASVLHLIDQGVPREKIELWHHDIDGGGETFMDWPITPAYCREVAKELGMPIYFSHREGGFKAEMLKENDRSKPIHFETPDGVGTAGGLKGDVTTRRQFPQTGANMKTRWCSGSLKIDVMSAAINNQKRFDGKRVLVVTGERGEESNNRLRYQAFQPHGCHALKRHVDHWRPVHKHTEAQVWDSIRSHGIVPHPAYQIGYSRLSCRNCIFADADQLATNRAISPHTFDQVADYETEFGKTIHRTESVRERAEKGRVYAATVMNPDMARLADSKEWHGPVRVKPRDWQMPAGAFGEGNGPS